MDHHHPPHHHADSSHTHVHRHGEHEHEHEHGHDFGHEHEGDHHHHTDHAHHHHETIEASLPDGDVLVIRPAGGLSGDIMVAGLARMADLDGPGLTAIVEEMGIPALLGSVDLHRQAVSSVHGWTCGVSLPHEHAHRTMADIRVIIGASTMTDRAKSLAEKTFTLLAEAEGRVHDMPTEQVTFHEVGALDSILDICLSAVLFDRISPAALICGPLPICDGVIRCSHGLMPSPAPAVLELLDEVPVRGMAAEGETVTPTAIALLKGLGASFGTWPHITIKRKALAYGTKVFPNVPNGAIFALGEAFAHKR